MKLTKATCASDIKREWHLINLEGEVLGRVASRIAQLLMGKTKPYFCYNLDCGDYVVVINSKKIKVTGSKNKQKTYSHFSGYPGGQKIKTYEQVMKENPNRAINEAVAGMLPKNKLRDSMLKRLYVYPDDKHKYTDKFKSK